MKNIVLKTQELILDRRNNYHDPVQIVMSYPAWQTLREEEHIDQELPGAMMLMGIPVILHPDPDFGIALIARRKRT